jgi:hypothetical protein
MRRAGQPGGDDRRRPAQACGPPGEVLAHPPVPAASHPARSRDPLARALAGRRLVREVAVHDHVDRVARAARRRSALSGGTPCSARAALSARRSACDGSAARDGGAGTARIASRGARPRRMTSGCMGSHFGSRAGEGHVPMSGRTATPASHRGDRRIPCRDHAGGPARPDGRGGPTRAIARSRLPRSGWRRRSAFPRGRALDLEPPFDCGEPVHEATPRSSSAWTSKRCRSTT